MLLVINLQPKVNLDNSKAIGTCRKYVRKEFPTVISFPELYQKFMRFIRKTTFIFKVAKN